MNYKYILNNPDKYFHVKERNQGWEYYCHNKWNNSPGIINNNNWNNINSGLSEGYDWIVTEVDIHFNFINQEPIYSIY